MIYALVGLSGLLFLACVNGLAVLAGRALAVRLLGLGNAPILSLRRYRTDAPLPRWKAALVLGTSFLTAYLFAGCLCTATLRADGLAYTHPEGTGAVVAPLPGTSAEAAGVRTGDDIVMVEAEPISGWQDLAPALRRHAGQSVELHVRRESQQIVLSVNVPAEGRIGVTPLLQRRPIGLGEAIARGFTMPLSTAFRFVRGIIDPPPPLAGPVATARALDAAARSSWLLNALSFVALLNGSLGLLFALVFAFVVRAGPQDPAR